MKTSRFSLILLPAFLLVFLCNGQSLVTQKGVVKDSLMIPIPSVTFVARGIKHNDFKYTSSDLQGVYEIELMQGLPYLLSVRSIGYETLQDTINLKEDRFRNYILKRSKESLDSILIKARAPVLKRGDTTAYRVEYFLTGEERKARDILEKIPGVEVDSRGNVQVQGKNVTTLMVDGKVFFSGDEKLGVNNIPSDVIDEIEIIQNYDPIPFMKKLKESEQIALNIKLKENKKSFVFGDAGVGAGYEDTYNINTNLFYYSKKLGVNFIGGGSNDGDRTFSVQDYIDFEGGTSLLLNNADAYFEILNSDVAGYLRRDDFIENQNIVGAANLVSEISARSTFTAYSVWLDDESAFRSITDRFYPQLEIEEDLRSESRVSALLGLTKLKWQYRKTTKNYWDFSALLRNSTSDSNSDLISSGGDRVDRFTVTTGNNRNYNFELLSAHNAEWSDTSTIKWETKLQSNLNENDILYNFNEPVFSNLINYQGNAEDISVLQNRESRGYRINSRFDYYLSLNRHNQLNPKGFLRYQNENFKTSDAELLNNSAISLQERGFNNDLDFETTTIGVGLDYYRNKNYNSVRIGFFLNHYHYSNQNFFEPSTRKRIIRFLPKFEYNIDFLKNRKLDFNYSTQILLPNASALANRFRLGGYNSIILGDSSLEDQYLHQARISYSSGTRAGGHLFFSSVSYNYRNRSVSTLREFEDIDQITRYVLLNEPNQNLGLSASSTILTGNWRYIIRPSYRLSLSNDIINQELVSLEINRLGYNLRAVSNYRNWVNFDVGFNQTYTMYNGFRQNRFANSTIKTEVSHDIDDSWIVSTNYDHTFFKNLESDQRRNYAVLNAKVNYRPLKSNWSFDLKAYNVLNASSRLDSSISDFIVNDTETFVLPFRFVFKASYNF